MARRQKGRSEDETKRVVEAIAACVGAVLTFATLGIIVWSGLTDGERPALISLMAGATHPYEHGFAVEIIAINTGKETASALAVEGSLRRDQEIVETSEVTFDYLAAQSRRRGILYFTQDPNGFELELVAKGYVDP